MINSLSTIIIMIIDEETEEETLSSRRYTANIGRSSVNMSRVLADGYYEVQNNFHFALYYYYLFSPFYSSSLAERCYGIDNLDI